MTILIPLFVVINSLLLATALRFLVNNSMKKSRKKHLQAFKKMISEITVDKVIPVLKERNITNFLLKDGDISIEVAYNGKTIYAKVKADIYRDSDVQDIYSFEYDLHKEYLVYTDRSSDSYKANNLYEEMNPYFASLRDKLIDIDWESKSIEPVENVQEQSDKKTDNSFEQKAILSIKRKAEVLLDKKELLNEEEIKTINRLIKDDIEETTIFFLKQNKRDRDIYKPMILEKLLEIDNELQTITKRLEERKYQTFKEKLKEEYHSED